MRAMVSLGLFCAITAVTLAAADVTPEQIQKAVKELGDDNYFVREKATQFLWSAGAAAEPALREALKDKDAEVVARARDLLNKIPFGITPGSPKKYVNLIARARAAPPEAWPELAAEILGDGPEGLEVARMIADKQATPERRKQYQRGLDREGWRAAARFIALGKIDVAEDLLRRSAVVSAGAVAPNTEVITHYAAFLRERGALSQQIEQWKSLAGGKSGIEGFLPDGTPDSDAAKCILAFLHTANGDAAAAQPFFDSIGRAEWLEQSRFNSGAWLALAESAANDYRDYPAAAVGLKALYFKLGGNQAGETEARAAFAKLADDGKGQPATAWLAFRGFLFLRQVDEAMRYAEVSSTPQSLVARAEIVAQRGQIDEALKLLAAMNSPQTGARLMADQTKTRLLYLAGRRDALTEHLAATRRDRYAPGEHQVVGDYLDQLIAFGLTEEAINVAAALLKGGQGASETFAKLHPTTPAGAEAWFTFLRHFAPTETPAETLKRLTPLVDPRLKEPKNQEQLEKAITWARARPQPERDKLLRGFGDVCAAVRIDDKAVALLQEGQGYLRLGDYYAESGRWADAAAAYEKAARPEDRVVLSLPLFMAGFAKEKAGDGAGGKALQLAARAMLLGDEKQRADFYEELTKRTYLDPSIRGAVRAERQLLVDLSHPKSNAGRNAQSLQCQDSGAYVDPERAVGANERLLVRMLRTNAYFRRNDGYLIVLHRATASHARAHLAAGRVEDAMRVAKEAHALLPGSTALAVELVPALRKMDKAAEADEFYALVAGHLDKQLKEYPDSEGYMVDRARLAVRCGKDLDAALALARKATELAPANISAWETLAEVQFQRKDASAAKETLAKAQALQPLNRYLPKLVKRVEAGDPAAPLPER